MKYAVIRTDTADAGIRKIILYIAQNFGSTAALEKLDEIEKRILELGDDPYIGTEPRYLILKRQGYKVLILEKDLNECKEQRKIPINRYICGCRKPVLLQIYFKLNWITRKGHCIGDFGCLFFYAKV